MSGVQRRGRGRSTGVRVALGVFLVALLVLVGVGVVRLVGVVTELAGGGGNRCTLAAGEAEEPLTSEQAANAATIAQVAQRRDLPPRAVTIAITTVIQESGLRNLDYGDRDSLGLFQQRPSMDWGSPDEVRDPVYASDAFYDVLLTIPDWETDVVNDVAQAVQRSGFPDAYGDHEGEGRVIASVLVGESGGALGLACRIDPESIPTGSAADVLARVERQLGLPAEAGSAIDGQARVTVSAGSPQRADAVAAWALAHAPYAGFEEIRVADRRWRVGEDTELPWPTVDGDEVAPGDVVLTLHRNGR